MKSLKGSCHATRLAGISRLAQGRNDFPSDVTSVRVDLDVRWTDQSTSLPSGL